MNVTIGATITVQFKARNIIDRDTLNNYYGDGQPATLETAVKDAIEAESLFGIVDDEFIIVRVEELIQ